MQEAVTVYLNNTAVPSVFPSLLPSEKNVEMNQTLSNIHLLESYLALSNN